MSFQTGKGYTNSRTMHKVFTRTGAQQSFSAPRVEISPENLLTGTHGIRYNLLAFGVIAQLVRALR